jgi:hypothetical protein
LVSQFLKDWDFLLIYTQSKKELEAAYRKVSRVEKARDRTRSTYTCIAKVLF